MISSTTPRFAGVDRSNQESKRELLDPASEHSTAIWDQQGRPVEEIIFLSQGMRQLMWDVLFMWFTCWSYLPYVLVKKHSVGVYPFRCKVYVHCIHCVYGHSGVDSKDKHYTFCTLCLRVLFTFHIYLNTISYQVAAGLITWIRKGHNLLFVNFTFYVIF